MGIAVVLGGVVFASVEAGAVASSRTREAYQSITDRNPFGLRPPPVPVELPVVETKLPPAAKVDIFLTGITTVGYPRIPKRAYIQVKAADKKEPITYMLSEGQAKDEIEVLEINEKRPVSVKIRMAGTDQVLSFETNGIKPPNSLIAGVPGGLTNAMGSFQPGPTGMNPHPQGIGTGLPNSRGGGMTGGSSGGAPNNLGASKNLPTRMLRGMTESTALQATPLQAPPESTDIDPAEQYLRLKIEETLNKQQGKNFPPIPQLH